MSDGLVAHVLDLLADWGGVSARRMFRSHGLYRHGVMFGLISGDVLYLRVDDRNRADFVAAGARPVPLPARTGPLDRDGRLYGMSARGGCRRPTI